MEQKYKWSFFIILLVCINLTQNQVTVQLPVPQELVIKLTLSIQKLQQVLAAFGTRYENKFAIYKRVQFTKIYLTQLNDALCQYNNVVAGAGNKVNGTKNIVIGNYNNIQGSNNWVFISSFTGKINGDLLVGQWRIQIDKVRLILINPRLAISFLDQQKNKHYRDRYGKRDRQLCKWGKQWNNPNNDKADGHWGKFLGYKDWRNNDWKKERQNQLQNNWGQKSNEWNQKESNNQQQQWGWGWGWNDRK